jgi:hypothetical protein
MQAMRAPTARVSAPISGCALRHLCLPEEAALRSIALCMMRCKNLLTRVFTPSSLKFSDPAPIFTVAGLRPVITFSLFGFRMKKQLLSGLVAAAVLGTMALPVSAQNLAIVNGKAVPKERAEVLRQQVERSGRPVTPEDGRSDQGRSDRPRNLPAGSPKARPRRICRLQERKWSWPAKPS